MNDKLITFTFWFLHNQLPERSFTHIMFLTREISFCHFQISQTDSCKHINRNFLRTNRFLKKSPLPFLTSKITHSYNHRHHNGRSPSFHRWNITVAPSQDSPHWYTSLGKPGFECFLFHYKNNTKDYFIDILITMAHWPDKTSVYENSSTLIH